MKRTKCLVCGGLGVLPPHTYSNSTCTCNCPNVICRTCSGTGSVPEQGEIKTYKMKHESATVKPIWETDKHFYNRNHAEMMNKKLK